MAGYSTDKQFQEDSRKYARERKSVQRHLNQFSPSRQAQIEHDRYMKERAAYQQSMQQAEQQRMMAAAQRKAALEQQQHANSYGFTNPRATIPNQGNGGGPGYNFQDSLSGMSPSAVIGGVNHGGFAHAEAQRNAERQSLAASEAASEAARREQLAWMERNAAAQETASRRQYDQPLFDTESQFRLGLENEQTKRQLSRDNITMGRDSIDGMKNIFGQIANQNSQSPNVNLFDSGGKRIGGSFGGNPGRIGGAYQSQFGPFKQSLMG